MNKKGCISQFIGNVLKYLSKRTSIHPLYADDTITSKPQYVNNVSEILRVWDLDRKSCILQFIGKVLKYFAVQNMETAFFNIYGEYKVFVPSTDEEYSSIDLNMLFYANADL